ncbi:MAG: ThiF family adenylyltransferase [Candidatus Thermoplasmatota archaeon]|nr:ThiF family adenylyltransferase [Candidatus Thermoplasmatota archaeon]
MHSTPLKENRYSRQILLPEIGPEGQRKLARSKAVVIGCGALGTNALSFLVRAGVGQVKIVDRDIVDLSNLQRQALFEEADVGRPKAKVAEERLGRINSEIKIKGLVADLTHANIEGVIKWANVVLDATDNMDTRFLVNDACVKHGIPWVYAGAVGVTGMVMPVIPGGPCLRCVFPNLPRPGQLPTCDTAGIVNTLPGAIASLEVTEAFKIMQGKEPIEELMVLDVWHGDLQRIKVRRNPGCGTCGRRDFKFLQARERKTVVSLCGRNAVQIRPAKQLAGGLADLRRNLARSGEVEMADGVLKFKAKGVELTVFPDGRTIIGGTTNLSKAKTIFSKYIGD